MSKIARQQYRLDEMERGDRFTFPAKPREVFQHRGRSITTGRAIYQRNGNHHELIKYVDNSPDAPVIFLRNVHDMNATNHD
jgi:hypothetical protein